MKKVYFINSEECYISEELINENHFLEEMYRLIGCSMVEIAGMCEKPEEEGPGRWILYVDEEGALKSPKHFFYHGATHSPFAGNGVLVEYSDRREFEEIVNMSLRLPFVKSITSFIHRIDPAGEFVHGRSVYTRVGSFSRN